MEREYQICKRCLMDSTDPDNVFDSDGICKYCKNALKRLNEIYFVDPAIKKERLNQLVNKIKKDGKNKKYDCIIGLSGGTDSSYLAYYIVKELNLRPLAVHIDNGWNTELAIKNIDNLVNKLDIDLFTYVIDWEEFRDLQLAYLKASVIDIEVLSDNPIFVVISRVAKRHHAKYFLGGMNIASESIMPSTWLFPYKSDPLNIRSIYKKFGSGRKLKTYPIFSVFEYLLHRKILRTYNILDFINYNKIDAVEKLRNEFEWREYGGKHHESFITKFYQTYILPNKFNVDKRKAHLSSLILSNQIKRDEALAEIQKPLFTSNLELENSISYFIKKIGITRDDLEMIMHKSPVSHYDYKTFVNPIKKIASIIKR